MSTAVTPQSGPAPALPIKLDAEGFLVDASQWTPAVAEALAGEEHIALSPMHWKVLEFVRQEYAQKKASPGLRRVSVGSGVAMKDLYALFPRTPGKTAARLAGAPKPRSCL